MISSGGILPDGLEGAKMKKNTLPRCRGLFQPSNPWKPHWGISQCKKRAPKTLETTRDGETVHQSWCGDDVCASWIRSGKSDEWFGKN